MDWYWPSRRLNSLIAERLATAGFSAKSASRRFEVSTVRVRLDASGITTMAMR